MLRNTIAAFGAVAALSVAVMTPPFAGAAQAAIAPSCVKISLNDEGAVDYLTVTNNCDRELRLKVKLAYETDIACTTYYPGQYRSYSWTYPGRFDGVVTC